MSLVPRLEATVSEHTDSEMSHSMSFSVLKWATFSANHRVAERPVIKPKLVIWLEIFLVTVFG
jgi:hypothetical protein